jgi:hypothetical protein
VTSDDNLPTAALNRSRNLLTFCVRGGEWPNIKGYEAESIAEMVDERRPIESDVFLDGASPLSA